MDLLPYEENWRRQVEGYWETAGKVALRCAMYTANAELRTAGIAVPKRLVEVGAGESPIIPLLLEPVQPGRFRKPIVEIEDIRYDKDELVKLRAVIATAEAISQLHGDAQMSEIANQAKDVLSYKPLRKAYYDGNVHAGTTIRNQFHLIRSVVRKYIRLRFCSKPLRIFAEERSRGEVALAMISLTNYVTQNEVEQLLRADVIHMLVYYNADTNLPNGPDTVPLQPSHSQCQTEDAFRVIADAGFEPYIDIVEDGHPAGGIFLRVHSPADHSFLEKHRRTVHVDCSDQIYSSTIEGLVALDALSGVTPTGISTTR